MEELWSPSPETLQAPSRASLETPAMAFFPMASVDVLRPIRQVRIGLFILRIQAQQLQAMLIRCPMGPFEPLLGHLSEAGTAM